MKPGGPDVGKQQWLGMMTGGVMLLVLVWAAMQSSDAPDESRADAETGLDAVEKPFGALADLTTGPVEPSLSWPLRSNSMALESTTAPGLDEMVDLARFNFFKDFEYWQRVARSQNIKIYLNWPQESTETRDRLLSLLLSSGFSIDQLYNSDWALRSALLLGRRLAERDRMPQINRLKEQGLTDDEIQWNLQRKADFDRAEQIQHFMALSGIHDKEVAARLIQMGIDLQYADTAKPRSSKPVQGEPILTDDLWLTDELRQVAARYTGPSRHVRAFDRNLPVLRD